MSEVAAMLGTMLVAMLAFDDQDPRLLSRLTSYAHDLSRTDPVEFARVLHVMADACLDYAADLERHRLIVEDRLAATRTRQASS